MVEDLSGALMQMTGAAFAGVCVYIAVAQHPVRLRLAPVAALEYFRAVVPRAEKVQAPLLVVCLVAVAVHLVVAPTALLGLGGALLLAVLVQTVATVLPINRRLLSGATAEHLTGAQAALARWGALHRVRTALAVGGAVLLWA